MKASKIKERAKTKLWHSKLEAWLLLLSAQEKKEALAVIFLVQLFFNLVHLFQMCCSDVGADAESVCLCYLLKGNSLCGVIDFHHFVSAVNIHPKFAVEWWMDRCNLLYAEQKSDLTTYCCALRSHLNCRWVMKPLFLVKTGIFLQLLHLIICCSVLINT